MINLRPEKLLLIKVFSIVVALLALNVVCSQAQVANTSTSANQSTVPAPTAYIAWVPGTTNMPVSVNTINGGGHSLVDGTIDPASNPQ
jgi:hypothetical protein